MPKALTFREVLRRLRDHDPRFEILSQRGKGSECMLYHPDINGRSQSIPVKNHGAGTDIYVGALKAIIRRFNLPSNFFN